MCLVLIPLNIPFILKKNMNILKTVLELLKYEENKGIICVDLKMMNFLLGQQGGYTNKYLCFLYLWDSRAKDKLYWLQKEWSERESLTMVEKNAINEPLVDCDKIVFHLLTNLDSWNNLWKRWMWRGIVLNTCVVFFQGHLTKNWKQVFLIGPRSES